MGHVHCQLGDTRNQDNQWCSGDYPGFSKNCTLAYPTCLYTHAHGTIFNPQPAGGHHTTNPRYTYHIVARKIDKNDMAPPRHIDKQYEHAPADLACTQLG